MKGFNANYNKTKALKLFLPIPIYSFAFLITDYMIIAPNQYQDIIKYYRKYYTGLICLYIVISSLSYYLNDILSWIYLGILGYTLNILFLFSDNVNLNQFKSDDNTDTIIKKQLTIKYWVNVFLMLYLILMIAVIVHSHKKLIMSSLTEDISSIKDKEE